MSLLRSSVSDAKLDRWIISFLGAGVMFSGCSKDAADNGGANAAVSAVASAESSGAPGQTIGAVGDNASANTKRRRDEVWTDDKGQKWFGNVPMDAFFDQPYEVAANQTPLGNGSGAVVATATGSSSMGSNGTSGSKPAGGDPAAEMNETVTKPDTSATTGSTTTTASAAGSGDSWAALISSTTLDDEVKSIRNFLNENVHSVGTFNSSMLMIPPKAAAIGALAGVAMEHPDAVSWKDDAKYIRDLAKKMNSAPLQRGAKDQKRIEALYDALSDTLNRSKPAGLEEPPETDAALAAKSAAEGNDSASKQQPSVRKPRVGIVRIPGWLNGTIAAAASGRRPWSTLHRSAESRSWTKPCPRRSRPRFPAS
jgi:hypothetical protein